MLNQDDFFIDPFGFIARLYPKAYIGGWNAAEKWDLLDEGTRRITLFSVEDIPEKELYGVDLRVQILPPDLYFGVVKMDSPMGGYLCSDIEKTILDSICYPEMFGDNLNVKDIFKNYMQRDDKDFKKLQDYFKKSGHPERLVQVMKEGV